MRERLPKGNRLFIGLRLAYNCKNVLISCIGGNLRSQLIHEFEVTERIIPQIIEMIVSEPFNVFVRQECM